MHQNDQTKRPAAPLGNPRASVRGAPPYKRLLESTRAIPWEFDLGANSFTRVGPQVEALLGYPPNDWTRPGFWFEHMHPEDRAWAPQFCHEAAARNEDHEFEYRMIAADGRTVWLRDHVNVVGGPQGPTGLKGFLFDITEQKRAQEVMESLARTSSVDDADAFFRSCVRDLAEAYGARFAFIGLLLESGEDVQTLANWNKDHFAQNFAYNLEGTPCKDILDLSKELIPRDASRLYPTDRMLVDMGIDSYFGAPLVSSDGRMLGLVSVMDTKPMELTRWTAPILGVFATRVAVELERKQAIDALRELNASLEARVRQRTTELEAANHELEAFSYSVSHDLRAPLRAVDGFSQFLLEDYAAKLDEVGRGYLARIRSGAQNMSALIDDMLKLSRVTRAPLQPHAVDLSARAREIAAGLQDSAPDRVVHWEIAEGLRCSGDPGLMHVALENLLSNAWKYTAKRPEARIRFDAFEQDGATVFRIRDNGAGFDMKYVGKLFRAFQRLHRREEFEGTGIGLATVARIIHRHGGRVWADAQPDAGATFCFTVGLPAE